MTRPKKERRGQFIIIAVLLAALMLISMGALMHSAVTYYKHEPWEEYSTLVGDVEINSAKLVELSLAKYTNSDINSTILTDNLERWQNNLTKIYPSDGIVLRSSGYEITQGMSPTAKVDFTLDIRTIGLSGYKFSVTKYLSLQKISTNLTSSICEITVFVKSESGLPIQGLNTSNFKVNNTKPIAVRAFYDRTYILVYIIQYKGTLPTTIDVWDQRGIHATGTIS